MAKKPNTKHKLLYILEILNNHSSKDNILQMRQIQDYLDEKGIEAERRSIIRDMNTLQECGFTINFFAENRIGYYREENKLEPHEVRILIDAVQSSYAITQKETVYLIKKLKELTDQGTSASINRTLSYFSRPKSENEQIFSNIDVILDAIESNKKIEFKYFDYNIEKKAVFRLSGSKYIYNPYSMAWNNDLYYLIGNCDHYDNISQFRIDRMNDVEIVDEKRKPAKTLPSVKGEFNTLDHVNKSFNMYSGEKIKVELKFNNNAVNSVIDRFGKSISIIKIDDEHFKIYFDAFDGEGLIYWIMQFAECCEVLSPLWLRNEILRIAQHLVEKYTK